MIKRIALVAVVLLLAAIAWFGPEIVLTFRIGTGYLARQMCSCVFVAERPESDCREDMLSQLDAVSAEVESDGVRTSFPPLASRFARHRPGFGCTLQP